MLARTVLAGSPNFFWLLGARRCDQLAARYSGARRLSVAPAVPSALRETPPSTTIARLWVRRDTFAMRVPAKLAFLCVATCFAAVGAFADEIRLKDGKKLYGVIVAFEDNMFKVKTDYGFVLVEKDKIASIVPNISSSAASPSATAAPAARPAAGAKPAKSSEQKPPAEPEASSLTNTSAADTSTFAAAKPKISSDPVRPALPASTGNAKITAPAIKTDAAPANPVLASTAAPAQPKAPEPVPNHEQVQGNLYTNFSHGFRMYKAPSWELIEDARKALPNAIVAMGTSNESTLMVVGQEPLKDSLDACANSVEKRLREIYTNYRFLSRRKTVVGGAPAVEFKYRGMADEHDWSGTLVVVARDQNVLTMLGMTYADNDLIQIQENVIARTISSTDFNVR
jgi:hypothetical protein